jgi:hypothetical protein
LLQRTPLPVEDIMHGSIPVVTIPPPCCNYVLCVI